MQINLMIIGAQKSGTTALNHYIAQHPKIFTHFTQEFKMFLDKNSYEKGLEYYLSNCVENDILKSSTDKKFVAKNVGVLYKPEMMESLYRHNNDVKIIITLRNPIDRAYSAFWYNKSDGTESYDKFEDAIYINDISRFNGNKRSESSCDYLGRGEYSKWLDYVYEVFPAQNVKVFIFEEIIKDLNFNLNQIIKFVGIEEEYKFDSKKKYNKKTNIKSNFIARIFEPGKLKIVKNLIPFKLRLILRDLIRNMNKTDEIGKIEMDEEIRKYLKSHYNTEVTILENKYGLTLRDSWKDFSNS